MTMLNKEGPERQEIEALLPWHAAGTLNRRDSERVERAIAADRELARRFQLVREEQHETIHLNESLGVPSTRAMEKLFAAIEAEGAKTPARRPLIWPVASPPSCRALPRAPLLMRRPLLRSRCSCRRPCSPPS